jgi:hypothetical protein
LSEAGDITVSREFGAMNWDISELGTRTEYVCADVILDSYHAAGINAQDLLLTSRTNDGRWEDPMAAPHNATAYGQYLYETGQLRSADEFPYYQGEILIGYQSWGHSAVVVKGGYDSDSVRLVQACYSCNPRRIEEITLTEWLSRTAGSVWHGHPSQEELDRIQ